MFISIQKLDIDLFKFSTDEYADIMSQIFRLICTPSTKYINYQTIIMHLFCKYCFWWHPKRSISLWKIWKIYLPFSSCEFKKFIVE